MMSEILREILFGLMGSSVWGVLGYLIYRKERNVRRNLAFFKLLAGMGRLKDVFVEIRDFSSIEARASATIKDARHHADSIRRYVSDIHEEWIITNLPHKTKDIVWMADIDYVLGNAREIGNTLNSIEKLLMENNTEDVISHLVDMNPVCADAISAIDHQLEIIPDRYKKLET